MGLMDALNKEDRMEIKFSTLYELVKGCTQRELLMNAINCDVPHVFIRETMTGKQEELYIPESVAADTIEIEAQQDQDGGAGKTSREQAHAVARRRKAVDAGKIIALHNAGWNAQKIADELGVSDQTVYNYLKKYKEENKDGGIEGTDSEV